MIELAKNYSISARRMKRSEIRELLKITNRPGMISLAGGLPAPETFPVEEIREITNYLLDHKAADILQYGPTEGYTPLREELVKWMKKENADVCIDNILVTTASQQGLDLVGKVFLDPSDPVLVELPSYLGGLQAFTAYAAHMYGIPSDDEGIRVDLLEKRLKELKASMEHYKIIYVVPDFQNPAGVTLSPQRRNRIIELSEIYDVVLLEDTPYRDLRYDGDEPPSLYSLDYTDNVVSMRTFSKILAPGFRIGWIVGHQEIIKKLTVAKQATDLCTASFTQAIAAEFMRRGLLEPHIQKIKEIYKKKKDYLLDCLQRFMPQAEGLKWTRPEGGLFLWLTMPEYISADEMFPEAVENNIAYVVGSAFHCHQVGHNTMRLNFSYPSEAEMEEGVKRLARVIEKRLVGHKSAVSTC